MKTNDLEDYEPSPPTLPTKAYVKGLGTVRVVEYLGDGYFRVVDFRDEYRTYHRASLSFRK